MLAILLAILVLIACLPAMSCDSCTCDVTCSPYQANSSVQINLLHHSKVDWYKTHSILAHSLLTHLTCVKWRFPVLSRIAHCNWNSGVSHAICHWSSHEAQPLHPVITCVIVVCNVGLETLKQLYTLQVLSAMCTLHAFCTSCLNSQVYSMHICIIRAVCSVASNGSCVCGSRHVLEHCTCTVPCFNEVPTHGHFKCLPLTTFNFVKLHFSKAAHNYADSSEFLLYQCYQQLVYSKCILVTPVHCLYSTVKLVVHGGVWG